jgi:hypothetical protein
LTSSDGTTGATLKKIYDEVRNQGKMSNHLARAFFASKKKRPTSTTSERKHHQDKFKNDSIDRYHAQSPTSKHHIYCAVLGVAIRRDDVTAGHLCGLDEQDALPVLGKTDPNYKWSPENCVLMYKSIERLYDTLDVTLLYRPVHHCVVLQVLYDDVLTKPIVSDFNNFEGYSTMSKNQQKKLRKKFSSFADINGRVLSLPPLALPSRTVLHWAAKSAYEAALSSDRSHACASASVPSEEEWAAIGGDLTPSASRLTSFIEEELIASDVEDTEESEHE